MKDSGLGRTSDSKKKDSGFFEIRKEKLWRYRDAARFFGVSERTLSRRVKANTIPYTSVGDSVRFCPWVLRLWAENGGSL